MDSITIWINNAGRRAIDKVETTELLAKLGKTEGRKEREQLINKIAEGNLKLVYTTVKLYCDKRRFRWNTERTADLLQVGFEGLRHAISRYDATKGTRLSTIAVPWIKQKLGRYLTKCEQQIYTPENLVREVYHYKKHGTFSGTKSCPKNTNLVHIAAYALAPCASLDKQFDGKDGDGGCLADTISQSDTSNTGARYDKELMEIRDLMAKAQIEPRVQDYVLLYAEIGEKTRAFQKAGLKGSPRKVLEDAIERIQAQLV